MVKQTSKDIRNILKGYQDSISSTNVPYGTVSIIEPNKPEIAKRCNMILWMVRGSARNAIEYLENKIDFKKTQAENYIICTQKGKKGNIAVMSPLFVYTHVNPSQVKQVLQGIKSE